MSARPVAVLSERVIRSVFPALRSGLLGSALLGAVLASVLLSAGEARAALQNSVVGCEGLGTGICLPSQKLLFDNVPPYIVSDNDPLFNITVDDAVEINVHFPDLVSGSDMDSAGFKLIDLESIPDLILGPITDPCIGPSDTHCVDFINWNDIPTTRPFITSEQGVQTIEWTRFTDGDPKLGSIAQIRLGFVPEPGTASLLGLGLLAGFGVVGRSRREEN